MQYITGNDVPDYLLEEITQNAAHIAGELLKKYTPEHPHGEFLTMNTISGAVAAIIIWRYPPDERECAAEMVYADICDSIDFIRKEESNGNNKSEDTV